LNFLIKSFLFFNLFIFFFVSKLTFEVDQKTCVYLVDLNCKPKAFKKKKKKKKKKKMAKLTFEVGNK
jgi:hypothetical protein